MWSICVWSFVWLLLINGSSIESSSSLVKPVTVLESSIPDSEYEQVIAERYLFAPFANESTAWPVLNNIQNAWQTVPLPHYHS